MPSVAALTSLGLKLIDSRPGWCADDPDLRAVAHVFAKESERMQACAEEVRDGAIASRTNNLMLPLWETLLKLEVEPVGLSVEQRRERVISALRRAIADPSGLTWQERVTELIGPSWRYEEEAEQTLRIWVPWTPGSPNFELAKFILEQLRPAAWVLIVESEVGFILDQSKLDNEAFQAE